LLQAASKQKSSLINEEFDTMLVTMNKVCETFMATEICARTGLTGTELSTAMALDPKFVRYFFYVMCNTSAATKLPSACIQKPVLRKLIAERVEKLGSSFHYLDRATLFSAGKINWGKCGYYSFQMKAGTNTVQYISFVHDKDVKTPDISEEGITSDFSIEHGWSIKLATFTKGSRNHSVSQLFSEEQRKKLVGWTGAEKGVTTAVDGIVAHFATAAGAPQVEISKAVLSEETNKKRTEAMNAARLKLAETKSATAKKRKVSIAEATGSSAPAAASAGQGS